jgi:hypothetical protein
MGVTSGGPTGGLPTPGRPPWVPRWTGQASTPPGPALGLGADARPAPYFGQRGSGAGRACLRRSPPPVRLAGGLGPYSASLPASAVIWEPPSSAAARLG